MWTTNRVQSACMRIPPHPRTGITTFPLHLSTTTELRVLDTIPQHDSASRRSCFCFRGSAARISAGMAYQTFDSQLFHQVHKPLHRSGSFDTHSYRPRKCFVFTTSPVAVSNIASVCCGERANHIL
jgi:hypothetical protein